MLEGRPLVSNDSWSMAVGPSVGADLKMVHGPRITNYSLASASNPDGQKRAQDDALVVLPQEPSLTHGDVFAYAMNDTNEMFRPDPGMFIPPDLPDPLQLIPDNWLDFPILSGPTELLGRDVRLPRAVDQVRTRLRRGHLSAHATDGDST
jgi:hypothetical protein